MTENGGFEASEISSDWFADVREAKFSLRAFPRSPFRSLIRKGTTQRSGPSNPSITLENNTKPALLARFCVQFEGCFKSLLISGSLLV